MNVAEFFEYPVVDRLQRLPIRDITGHHQRSSAAGSDLGCGSLNGGLRTRRSNDISAGVRQAKRNRPPEPRGSADHDCYLAGKSRIVIQSLLHLNIGLQLNVG
jgi:hypothetical protein